MTSRVMKKLAGKYTHVVGQVPDPSPDYRDRVLRRRKLRQLLELRPDKYHLVRELDMELVEILLDKLGGK